MTATSSTLVKAIRQKDNYTFVLEWSDGAVHEYRLSDLQRLCPCAKCQDVNSGKQRVSSEVISETVRAKRIKNVGRYALKIDFTEGCSHGIYTFKMLRKIGK